MSLACRPELVLPLALVETVYPWGKGRRKHTWQQCWQVAHRLIRKNWPLFMISLTHCTCFDYFQDEFFLPLGMICIGWLFLQCRMMRKALPLNTQLSYNLSLWEYLCSQSKVSGRQRTQNYWARGPMRYSQGKTEMWKSRAFHGDIRAQIGHNLGYSEIKWWI